MPVRCAVQPLAQVERHVVAEHPRRGRDAGQEDRVPRIVAASLTSLVGVAGQREPPIRRTVRQQERVERVGHVVDVGQGDPPGLEAVVDGVKRQRVSLVRRRALAVLDA
jgi:hypothetical protein